MSEFAEGYAVGQGNNNFGCGYGGFGMGGDWLAIIVLFALLGNGGWGGAGAGGNLGYELGRVATTNDVASGFSTSTIMSNQRENQLSQQQGFADVQQTLCQGFNGITREISDCCCNTQRAIDASTDRILGFLTNEKISGLQAENAALTAQLSQNAQTRTLIDALRPTAVPAYLTCSPYQSVYGFGNGCGCGCG